MRVLCILTVWNEINYLPLKLEYCKQNKLEPYFIDNMSDDGTWEWLQENNIPSHRVDTRGSFDLRKLQDEIVKTIHLIKPDWAIYNGCDLFPVTLNPLADELQKLDEKGFNTAWINCINFFNTGEDNSNFDPFNTYFHYGSMSRFKMIHKYNPVLRYLADDVSFPGQNAGELDGIMINYGNTKNKEERQKTLERRRKAWNEGEPRGHGTHYLVGERKNWQWNRDELNDIRESNYYPYIQKLQEISDKIMKDIIVDTENDEHTIGQIRVAPSLSFFKNKLLKKYNLREYYDTNKPCIFNGIYTMDDYLSVIKHKGHKTIVWCGSDVQALNKSLIDKAGPIRHIAKSNFISNTLTKKGIPHILLPVTPTIPVKNYKKKGENIYFYRGGIDRNKYGGVLVDEIKKRTNYKIIEASHNTFKPDELEKVYESCFIGLRLTKHDGLPNTVLEMGLMGRKCLHNGNTPNSLNYESVDDIIKHIDNEYSKRDENSEKVVDDVYDFLNIDKEWLKV